jgi:hypothetical protein
MLAAAGANAAVLDVKDFSNNAAGEFFTPVGSELDSPYYRFGSEDWGWTHGAITNASAATAITLNISAFDVDEEPCGITGACEEDVIEVFDTATSTWVELGILSGADDAFSFTTFNLTANLFDDVETGLQVRMDIDSTNAGWLVSLAKSVISVDGAPLPNPNPSPVSEPTTLGLVGLSLAAMGFVARRRRKL